MQSRKRWEKFHCIGTLIQNINLLRVILLLEFKSTHQYQNNITIHAPLYLIV